MDIHKKASGSCLCGAVKVVASLEKEEFDACHCGMCRKWGGGPALTIDGGSNVQLEGREFISVYNSSDWAERGFCKSCGTHLFYRLKNSNYCNFSLGLFEDVDKLKFQMQIFIDCKPKFYEFANKTETMTEAEVIAKFGPPPTA